MQRAALTTRSISARLATPLLSRSYFAALYARTMPIKAKADIGYYGGTLKYFVEDDRWYDALVIEGHPDGRKRIHRAYGVDTDPRAYHHHYLLAPNFTTELLYAIPQDVWNTFIAALPNQRVVAMLNLAAFRHLYKGYNVAMDGYTELLQLRRAKLIARYHFLISNGFNVGHMSLSTLCDRLAKGEDINKLLAESFGLPMLTAEFFDKFSHHSEWSDVARIGELIKRRSLKRDGVTFDADKANAFIAALPSSQQSPHEFHTMLNHYSQITDSISRGFFAHFDRKNWELFEANVFYHQPFTSAADITFDFNLLRDYLDTLIANLVYPEIMRRVLTAYPGASDHLLAELMERSHSKAYYAVRGLFFALCADKTKLAVLVSQGKQWRENHAVIETKKPEKAQLRKNEEKWHALFEQQTIDSVTFTCITSKQADDDGYTTREKKIYPHTSDFWGGKDHIIQLQSTSGEQSRVELQVLTDYDGQSFVEVVQHVAQGRKKPSRELEAAVAQLVKKIEQGEITLNRNRGKIVTPKTETYLEMTHSVYPYSLSDENAQEQIYQVYKSAGVLPAFMVADNYRDMLSKAPELTALMDHIISSLGVTPVTIAADTQPSRPDECLIGPKSPIRNR